MEGTVSGLSPEGASALFPPPRPGSPSVPGPTVREALIWGMTRLKEAEVPDPRLSAELLLAEVLGVDRIALILAPERPLEDALWASFQEKIQRRSKHEPIAYLTGKKEFWSLTFQVNPSVLIPRPETELLVETALSLPWPEGESKTVLELGTGSGAVIISLALSLSHRKGFRFVATDVSPEALAVARQNAKNHGVEEKIRWVIGDWLSPFTSQRRWFDLILCNPPYVADGEWSALPPSVRDFEPWTALRGGADGLAAIRKILGRASAQLKVGGWLLLEIGETQAEAVREAAEKYSFHAMEILKDYSGKNRLWKGCCHG